MRKAHLIVIILSLLTSCNYSPKKEMEREGSSTNRYATNFRLLEEEDNSVTIEIIENWAGVDRVERYSLIDREAQIDNASDPTLKSDNISKGKNTNSSITIKTPLKRVICMSTSHLPFLSLLGVEENLVALSGARYLYDKKTIERVNSGELIDIGFEGSLNLELILNLEPDLVISYGISDQNNLYLDKMRQAGIKVMALGDYSERDPLGKVEYIKLFGALFQQKESADSIFNSIEESYLATKATVDRELERKMVLLNAPWKDLWYIPGEKSYISNIIQDAGGEVLLAKRGEGDTFAISPEEIALEVEKAHFWLHPNFYSSIKELKQLSPLIASFPVVAEGRVFNNTKRSGPKGGSDFWERGAVEPHLILQDLIKILHSNEIEEEDLIYYRELK